MTRIYWTVLEAVELLAEAHWVDLGGKGVDPDPVTLEALARALNARPEVLERVWDAWNADLTRAGWSTARRKQARHWLDTVVIGGITPA